MTIDLTDGLRSTTIPARPPVDDLPPQVRRRLRGIAAGDARNIAGAAISALCIALLLFGRVAPFSGGLGFAVVAFVVFLAAYAILVSLVDDRPVVTDKLFTVLLYGAALVTFATLGYVIGGTVVEGFHAIRHVNFFTQDMSSAGPLDPVSVGGVKHAVVGTLWITGIAFAITVPLGVTAAVYLTEVRGRLARFVRTLVDAMTALPSVLAGLFIYGTLIVSLGVEQSGIAAAVAVSIVMLPIIIRSAEVVLRLVPGNLREASAALGAEQWRTVLRVVLPTARSGLATSVILGVARGIGETAPVLLTAGYTAATNTDPLHGPMVSLPLFAFTAIGNSSDAYQQRGFAAALLLLVIVLVLFILGRIVGGRGPGHLSSRQAAKVARRSAADAERMGAGPTAANNQELSS